MARCSGGMLWIIKKTHRGWVRKLRTYTYNNNIREVARAPQFVMCVPYYSSTCGAKWSNVLYYYFVPDRSIRFIIIKLPII